MTLEQYNLLIPYRQQLYISEELGSCIQGKLCVELANIHNIIGFGHVDLSCGNCTKNMLGTLWQQVLYYEKQNNIIQ